MGKYTVPFRQDMDSTGLTEGWLIFEAESDGTASFDIHLYDGSTMSAKTAIYEDENDGNLLFCLPLYWLDDANSYAGKLSGALSITPLDARDKTINDTCVTGCGDNASLWSKNRNDAPIQLEPCGAQFFPDKTISESVQSSNFFFVTETPDASVAIAPNHVQYVENSISTISPVKEGLLSSEMGEISINADGTFTSTIAILERKDDQGNLEKMTLDVFGVIVPTTVSCCDASTNIAIGYGCYTFGNEVFRIRLFPTAYTKAPEPTLTRMNASNTSLLYRCASTAKSILMKRSDNGAFRHISWTGSYQETTLDASTPWQIVSLPMEGELAESEIVEIKLYAGKETYSIGTAIGTDKLLAPGWNLIGIPQGIAIGESNELDLSRWLAYSPSTNAYIRPSTLVPGLGYWVFVKQGEEYSISFNCSKLASFTPLEIPSGWSLMGFQGNREGVANWMYKDGIYAAPQDDADATTGVWIYK